MKDHEFGIGYMFPVEQRLEGMFLLDRTFLLGTSQIGDNCKIQNNVSIYDNVTLEEGVFCGPSMVFTNVYNPRSLIARKMSIVTPVSDLEP